jgi:hypothetical protein
MSELCFRLTYVLAASNADCSTRKEPTHSSCSSEGGFSIIRATSIQINRCSGRSQCIDATTYQCCSQLALLVPPDITHKFLHAEGEFSYNEMDFRKSIHPCLCDRAIGDGTLSNGLQCATFNEQREAYLHRLSVSAIITSDGSLPADVILFEMGKSTSSHAAARIPEQPTNYLLQYSSLLNHEPASDAPWSVMKAFPVHSVTELESSNAQFSSAIKESDEYVKRSIYEPTLPSCPVCLHRIEPRILGLPELKHQHRCSRWCSRSNSTLNDQSTCANETKLEPWPPPANCVACNVIRQRDSSLEVETMSYISTKSNSAPTDCLKCHKCSMTTTLWVCLTCGVVGCGRYTLKHAADHFTSTGHPYSLELATMRIWDYENGSFVHRRDLLECPVLAAKWGNNAGVTDSLQFSSPLIASSRLTDNESLVAASVDQHLKSDNALVASPRQNGLSPLHQPQPTCRDSLSQNHVPDKLSNPPKKSMMISEEYEALLQSALEDQAMHFEGEISHLRAQLATARMKQSECITENEAREINALRRDSERLQCEVEKLSTALLEIQSEESKSRALSQKLLREQSISKELLEKMRHDIRYEHDTCRQRMDDLELQIEDLTANLRLRTEISQSEELNEAQIFGTVGGSKDSSSSGKKKGKKSLRFGRKK